MNETDYSPCETGPKDKLLFFCARVEQRISRWLGWARLSDLFVEAWTLQFDSFNMEEEKKNNFYILVLNLGLMVKSILRLNVLCIPSNTHPSSL